MAKGILKGLAVLVIVFEVAFYLSNSFTVALLALCFGLALLPPSWDPAIQIKEYQIRKGTHPESTPCPHGFTDWDYCPQCRH